MSDFNSINIQLVNIPGGEIMLRDDRIKTSWKVEINPFQMSAYQVTQEQYFAITQKSPSIFKGPKNPVEDVSWIEAVHFCNDLSNKTGLTECYSIYNKESIIVTPNASGYRLPTEAEWEYACKAGTNKPRYGEIDKIAWYKENSEGSTHEVGMKDPNNWGIYDMIGNVWEWCSDNYDKDVYGTYRIFRGGGWCDEARGCLATNRRRSHPTFKIDDLGFRIARSI
jgi:formylglycine-generating enzyme required for sulfatase activity